MLHIWVYKLNKVNKLLNKVEILINYFASLMKKSCSEDTWINNLNV